MRNVVRQSRWTKSHRDYKNVFLFLNFQPARWGGAHLPLHPSFHTHQIFILSFLPLLPVSFVPHVASVFHFKLDCWDPNLTGEPHKESARESQGWWRLQGHGGGDDKGKNRERNAKWNRKKEEETREGSGGERSGAIRKVGEENSNDRGFESRWENGQPWTGWSSG